MLLPEYEISTDVALETTSNANNMAIFYYCIAIYVFLFHSSPISQCHCVLFTWPVCSKLITQGYETDHIYQFTKYLVST